MATVGLGWWWHVNYIWEQNPQAEGEADPWGGRGGTGAEMKSPTVKREALK